jgi:hypothetical protein
LAVCPHCKAEVAEDASFCPSCGQSLNPLGPGAEADRRALRWFGLFALLFLGTALLEVVEFGIIFSRGFSFSFAETAVVESAVGGVVGVAEVSFLILGLMSLSRVDRLHFSLPAKMSFFTIVGLPVELGIAVYFGSALGSLIPATPGGAAPALPTNQQLTQFLLVDLLSLPVGIILLVGVVGIILGMWRLGVRYQQSIVKAAAILYVFPGANVVGGILMVVGVRRARKSLESA